MAKQRVINTAFWDDAFITELSPTEKLLFLYFLTNPLTDLCGAYQITMKRITFDTGLSATQTESILEKFARAGKVFYLDGWLIIQNFAKHQVNNPNVAKGIERSLNGCPDWVKDRLSKPFKAFQSLSKPTLPEPELKPIPKLEPIEEEPATPSDPKPDKKIILPLDWKPSTDLLAWTVSVAPGLNVSETLDDFLDFWRDIATRDNKRTLRGWDATWRKRVKAIAEKSNGTHKTNNSFGPKSNIAAIERSIDYFETKYGPS